MLKLFQATISQAPIQMDGGSTYTTELIKSLSNE
jgi:hypothetical protein